MRINLLTLGDCTDVNTWSNLPYYFYQNLLAQSVDVRPINLTPPENLVFAAFSHFMSLRARALRSVDQDNGHDVIRSRAYHLIVNRRLQSMARELGEVDLNVFLTFSFSSYRYASAPVVHFCDRTYEHQLEERHCAPTRHDRAFIRIDRQNIENADLVLTTGQVCADFIKSRYNGRRVFCLRGGNNTDAEVPDADRLIAEKEQSTDVLFIGRGAHKRGVDILIRAFSVFNERHGGRFTLHIVGVQPNELPEELRAPNPKIRFHGYLDRSVPADLQRYNDLLHSARMFVMPMRPGPFPGVIREVQLHCTPVIASNVSAGPEILTNEHDSVFVDSLEPEAFAHEMDRLIEDPVRWRTLALNGHAARRNQTWMNTVENFLGIVRECNLVPSRR